MTKCQAIIDTVLLCSMGLVGLAGVGRSNHVHFILKKCVYAKYGMHVELVKKRWVCANKECTLNMALRYHVAKNTIIKCIAPSDTYTDAELSPFDRQRIVYHNITFLV